MNFHVGTSGYSYKEWKGSFYPKKLPADEMLNFYSQHFSAVEINNTFYRMPTAELLKSWMAQVPANFQFVLKSPQRITHFRRLKNTDETVAEFLKIASVLKNRLGPLLFQLPGNMKKDAGRLKDFLKLLPGKHRIAFEFRHESWLDQEIYDLLADHHVALCVAEAEDELKIPLLPTADFGYVRLRLPEYSDANLKSWIKTIRKQKWKEVFVFFKHEDEAKGPRFARRFLELAE